MLKGKYFLSVLLIVLTLVSCQERGMKALEGEWLDAKNELQPLEVVEEDGKYKLVAHWGEYFVNMREDRYPEVFFNGKSYPITHDAKTDQLKFNGIPYVRKEKSLKMQFVGKWSDPDRETHFDIAIQNGGMIWDIYEQDGTSVRYYPKLITGEGFVFTWDNEDVKFELKGDKIVDSRGEKYERISK